MNDIQNYFIHGLVLIDVDGVRLNNLGIDNSATNENKTLTKTIRKGREIYPFVSGQAWRYWWREACFIQGWQLSPITNVKGQQYITKADPFMYADDDLFGYMSAQKEEIAEEDGEESSKKSKKPKTKDITLTRTSPLKNSILVSVNPTKPLDEFCSMTRQDDTPALYSREIYSTTLKGMFSLDLDQAGTFVSMNRSGYQNISKESFKEQLSNNARVVKDKKYKGVEKIRLDNKTRARRVSELISALKILDGGAGRTTNYASVRPDFIILCILRGGSNPFSGILFDDKGKIESLGEILQDIAKDYQDYILSDIYIGKDASFMKNVDLDLKELSNLSGKIKFHIGGVGEMIDKFVSENVEKIINQME